MAGEPRSSPPPGRSPGRPAIPADRFVDAALAIIDADGVDAVTMRAVAQRLGSGTATLYRHFDNRAHLLAAVVDRVLAEAADRIDAAAHDDWADELRVICRSTFDALRRHRNVLPVLARQLPSGEHAIAGRDRIIAVLLAGGCPPDAALATYATFARYVLGFAIQTSNGLGDAVVEPRKEAVDRADPIPTGPITNGTVGKARGIPLDDEFAFGLDLLILGLRQFIHATPRHDA